MPLTDSSAGYINPAIAALSVASMGGNKIALKLPGGEVHIVDGVWRMIPNGGREVHFVPGKGMVNPVKQEPSSPINQSPRAVRMPANRGLRLSGAGAISTAVTLAVIYSASLDVLREIGDIRELQKRQDQDVIGFILTGLGNELDALAQPAQQRQASNRRKRNPNERRVRIYGYSRRQA